MLSTEVDDGGSVAEGHDDHVYILALLEPRLPDHKNEYARPPQRPRPLRSLSAVESF